MIECFGGGGGGVFPLEDDVWGIVKAKYFYEEKAFYFLRIFCIISSKI
jgi:hypothetical protein